MKDRAAVLFLVIVVFFSCLPLFFNIQNISQHLDWLQILSFYRIDRAALLDYGQVPLRTHFFGGGYPFIANPQDGFLNPFFLPVLIFGEVAGVKINIFLAHLIGLFGMYYLTRKVLKYNVYGALFSTLVFLLGGHLHRLLMRGQEYICGFYSLFLPLILAFFIKSKENRRFLFWLVISMSTIITQAGLYAAPIILFLLFFALFETIRFSGGRLKMDYSYWKSFFLMGFFSIMLSAVKIIPMAELLIKNPRVFNDYVPFWYLSWENIYKAFFVRQQNLPSSGMHWRYFYLGYIPVILAALSLIIFWKENKRLLVLLLIFVSLSFGAHTKLDLFKYLHGLPVFSSIGSPTRYFMPAVIFIIALLSGRALLLAGKATALGYLAVLITIIVAVDLFSVNSMEYNSFIFRPGKPFKKGIFYPAKNLYPDLNVSPLIPKKMFDIQSWELTRPSQYELMLHNIGKINWYGNLHLEENAIAKYFLEAENNRDWGLGNYKWVFNPLYRGELFFVGSGAGSRAEFAYFSPNKMVVDVMVDKPDTLVINQNFHKYWKVDGGEIQSLEGRLAVKLHRAGEYRVKLTYVPLTFYAGLGISIITVVFFYFYFARGLL